MTATQRSGILPTGPTHKDLFFANEIISLCPFHDDFIPAICCDRPFSAVGIITGITCRAAAARIIGDYVINKVLVTAVPKLVCLTWLKEKCVARSNFNYPLLVTHAATARHDEVELRFSRMRVIGTKEFAFGNSH